MSIGLIPDSMSIGLISDSVSSLFPDWKFQLQKDEDGTIIAFIVPSDRSGRVTAGLPKGSKFVPNVRRDYDTKVEIIEGTGLFYQLGHNFVYYPGSTFDVEVLTLHGFVEVWGHTVFTKTITDSTFILMQARTAAANQSLH